MTYKEQVVSHFFDYMIPSFEYYVELSKKKDNKKSMLMNAALDVAGKLFHFRDKLEPLAAPNTFRRSDIAKAHPDFNWIADVFNASKHAVLKGEDRIIRHSSQIEETLVWTYFPYEGEEKYPRKFFPIVQFRILINPLPNKGTVRDLLEICTSVLNFWGQQLVGNGLIEKFSDYRYEGDDVLTQSQLDGNAPVHTKYDGTVQVVMISRYYEPTEKKFKRWGYAEDGKLISIDTPEDAPNLKSYLYYDPNKTK